MSTHRIHASRRPAASPSDAEVGKPKKSNWLREQVNQMLRRARAAAPSSDGRQSTSSVWSETETVSGSLPTPTEFQSSVRAVVGDASDHPSVFGALVSMSAKTKQKRALEKIKRDGGPPPRPTRGAPELAPRIVSSPSYEDELHAGSGSLSEESNCADDAFSGDEHADAMPDRAEVVASDQGTSRSTSIAWSETETVSDSLPTRSELEISIPAVVGDVSSRSSESL